MQKIDAGKLAVVKTTGEPVLVLGISWPEKGTPPPYGVIGVGGTKATVRRPVVTQNGAYHLVEEFYVEELELPEEYKNRLEKLYQPGYKVPVMSKPSSSVN